MSIYNAYTRDQSRLEGNHLQRNLGAAAVASTVIRGEVDVDAHARAPLPVVGLTSRRRRWRWRRLWRFLGVDDVAVLRCPL